MQKIGKEEAKDMVSLKSGRETLVSAWIKQLAAGEALIVKRSEWKTTYPPTRIARSISKKLGWTFDTGRLPDNTGWLIKRLS